MGTAEPNGVFEVKVLRGDRWQDAGSLSYDQFFLEKTIDIGPFLEDGMRDDDEATGGRAEAAGEETIQIRLLQKGGGAAHIDSVLLGGRPAGEAIIRSATRTTPIGESGTDFSWVQQKLSRSDFDVVDAFGETVELTFPASGADRMLRMVARVEGMTISTTPFQFPRENLYRPMNLQSRFYRYPINAVRGALEIDGDLEEVRASEPFFKEYSLTGSGHPSGVTYGWVRNDDRNLYVALDFTPDNTMDGVKDYAKVYAKIGDKLKEFKVSVPETGWGSPGFSYTNRVPYQHKVYEFRIPFSELGMTRADESRELQLAFAAYGTAAPPPTWGLTATSEGDGNGILTSSPVEVCFGNYCDGTFPRDPAATVVITAVPSTSSLFGGWTGCDEIDGDRCTLTLASDRAVAATFNAGTQAEFEWRNLGGSAALAMSSDGSVVAGWSQANPGTNAFRWTRNGGTAGLGNIGESMAYGISADGSVIVGWKTEAGNPRAFRWTEAGGAVSLGTLYPDYTGHYLWSYATGASANGNVVVGYGCDNVTECRAFRWALGANMVDLGTLRGGALGNGAWSQAWDVSGDGNVVVGWSYANPGTHAFRWTQELGMVDIGTFGGTFSKAFGVSADGSILVGGATNGEGYERAFRWTAGTGMVDLGTLGGLESRAWGISPDGDVIVGEAQAAEGVWHAFRWTQAAGMQTINQWLGNSGVNSALVHFTSARSVSADGSTVVGQLGGENGNAFLARSTAAPKFKKGDINTDTVIDLADAILSLQTMARKPVTGAHLSADVNGDGRIGLPEALYILQRISELRAE